MKNEIKNLKASLEVVRDYAKEAENLVTQINKETENITIRKINIFSVFLGKPS